MAVDKEHSSIILQRIFENSWNSWKRWSKVIASTIWITKYWTSNVKDDNCPPFLNLFLFFFLLEFKFISTYWLQEANIFWRRWILIFKKAPKLNSFWTILMVKQSGRSSIFVIPVAPIWTKKMWINSRPLRPVFRSICWKNNADSYTKDSIVANFCSLNTADVLRVNARLMGFAGFVQFFVCLRSTEESKVQNILNSKLTNELGRNCWYKTWWPFLLWSNIAKEWKNIYFGWQCQWCWCEVCK